MSVLGTFQALQHRAAPLFCEIELVRSALLQGATAARCARADAPTLVCPAKEKASEIACLAANEAVQMHGGIDMTDEFTLSFFMKRAKAGAESLGDAYYHSDRFAQLVGY